MLSPGAIIAFVSMSGTLHLHMVANRQADTVPSLESLARYAEQLLLDEGTVLSGSASDRSDLNEEIAAGQDALRHSGDLPQPSKASQVYQHAIAGEARLVAPDSFGCIRLTSTCTVRNPLQLNRSQCISRRELRPMSRARQVTEMPGKSGDHGQDNWLRSTGSQHDVSGVGSNRYFALEGM
jgi:hypothetical protein